jgi:hypothetical protein
VPQATNASLAFDFASLDSAGQYDVVVSNPGGVAVSDPARLMVVVPPEGHLGADQRRRHSLESRAVRRVRSRL